MLDGRNPADQGSDQTLAAYLDALVAALDLPSGDRADVREEVAAHIADLDAELREAGLTEDGAREEAIRRLGPPDLLGREMTRARQTRWALLAAVGGATWAGAGAAFRGLILGWAVVVGDFNCGRRRDGGGPRLTGSEPVSFGDPGWFTALQAVGALGSGPGSGLARSSPSWRRESPSGHKRSSMGRADRRRAGRMVRIGPARGRTEPPQRPGAGPGARRLRGGGNERLRSADRAIEKGTQGKPGARRGIGDRRSGARRAGRNGGPHGAFERRQPAVLQHGGDHSCTGL